MDYVMEAKVTRLMDEVTQLWNAVVEFNHAAKDAELEPVEYEQVKLPGRRSRFVELYAVDANLRFVLRVPGMMLFPTFGPRQYKKMVEILERRGEFNEILRAIGSIARKLREKCSIPIEYHEWGICEWLER